jgi:predicted membrane-bound spermidine synthase
MNSNRPPHAPADRGPARLSLAAAGAGLLLLSAASMAFEVILTHLFSLVFQYHFSFLAVSMAVLGLGIGAVISFYLPALNEEQAGEWLSQSAAAAALILPAAVIIFSLTGFVPGILWQALLGALPFVLVGLLTTRLYTLFTRQAAWLYALDLAGSALGLGLALLLLDHISAASSGIALGLAAALAALAFTGGQRDKLALPAMALGLTALVLAVNLLTGLVDLPRLNRAAIPADKTMFQVLADPAQQAQVIDSAFSAYARADLVQVNDPDQMYVFTNGGAGSYMLRYSGDLSSVSWLATQVEYLPFVGFQPKNSLILGAGAGKDVLQALLSGSEQITAVEVNPAMVAITRAHADYNGAILDAPGVTTVVADGRAFVARSADQYDMIYMNLVYSQAPTPGSSALSESYVFTTEAFQDYWQHLSADGRLAIVAHQGLEGSRTMITALKALELEGIPAQDALKHMALMMYNADDPNQAATVFLLQKSPLTEAQIQLLNQGGVALDMSPLYLPGVFETLFAGLGDGSMHVDDFLVQTDYNLAPTDDNQPFFFNLNPGLPEALRTLLMAAGAALILYLLAMLGRRSRPSAAQLVYFGGLGLGFMLIETPLIQRTILTAGSPTLSMAVVLIALMLGGGLGSWLSGRWPAERLWRRLSLAALAVAVLAAGLAFWQPALLATLSGLPAAARLILAGLSLLPLGFVMGMPFANGLRLAGERERGLLPYLWGWNAVTSVAGSALAAALALLIGFQLGLLAGAGAYLLAGAAAWWCGRRA